MRLTITLTITVLVTALLFTGCTFRDSARVGGQAPPDKGMAMTEMGIAGQMFTPGLHSDATIRPLSSPRAVGTATCKFNRNVVFTPVLRNQSVTPGAYRLPFSGLLPIIKLLNPVRWLAPWTAPGGIR